MASLTGPMAHPALFYGLGALCGIGVHRGLFIRGEWHVQAPYIVIGHVWIFFCFAFAAAYTRGTGAGPLFHGLVLMIQGYLPGLMTSIIFYRVFFHRLTKAGFPGPWHARITKLWHVWQCRNSKNHVVLKKLHEQYGDFVRTGPSEVTVFRPEVFMATDGPRSECIKSEWYDLLIPNLALVTARNKAIHAARRRQWNRGFSTKALKIHEEKIVRHLNVLDECIEADAKAGRASDARSLLYWFGFDAMGDFLLGQPFGMLQNQQWHHIVVRLQRALSLLGPVSPAPWLMHVGFKLSPRVGVIKDWFDMVAWCQNQMKARIADESRQKVPDLTHYFMMEDDEDESIVKNAQLWLNGDSLQAIVAGSGPTAVALMGLFTELGKNPEQIDKMYEELKNAGDTADINVLSKLPHLNACITETLRLYPALLTGGTRKTTEKGVVIGETFIPPHTTIVSPQYIISRRQDCFVRPLDFIPERWTSSPELVINPAATTPFGTGHWSCVGRPLALNMMRYVAARVVMKYTFRFAPGEDGRGMGADFRDQFVSNPGELKLCFELR